MSLKMIEDRKQQLQIARVKHQKALHRMVQLETELRELENPPTTTIPPMTDQEALEVVKQLFQRLGKLDERIQEGCFIPYSFFTAIDLVDPLVGLDGSKRGFSVGTSRHPSALVPSQQERLALNQLRIYWSIREPPGKNVLAYH
jgi:hypothetical protein